MGELENTVNETQVEEELFTEAGDIDAEAKVIADDLMILGYTVLEFSLMVAGVCFGFCLLCTGVCCCVIITRKTKRKRVKETPRED